jgi:hypothetical protein
MTRSSGKDKLVHVSTARYIGLGYVIGPDSRLSSSRSAGILFAWILALSAICAAELVFVTSGNCPSLMNLNCSGIFDNFVFPAMVFLLWVVTHMTVRLLKEVDSLIRGGLRSIVEVWSGADASSVHLNSQVFRVCENVSLRNNRSRKSYWIFMTVIFMGVVAFQLVAPFYANFQSWALMPLDYPVAFLAAICWALFYWPVVMGNSIWIAASSGLGFLRILHRLSKTKDVIILPISAHSERCVACFMRIAFLTSSIFTWVGVIIALLTIKLYKDNITLLTIVLIILLTPTIVFIVPATALKRLVKRGRENFVEKSLAQVSSIFKVLLVANEQKLNTVSERVLLEAIIWERALRRAETISVVLISHQSVLRTLVLVFGQVSAFLGVLGRLRSAELETILRFLGL